MDRTGRGSSGARSRRSVGHRAQGISRSRFLKTAGVAAAGVGAAAMGLGGAVRAAMPGPDGFVEVYPSGLDTSYPTYDEIPIESWPEVVVYLVEDNGGYAEVEANECPDDTECVTVSFETIKLSDRVPYDCLQVRAAVRGGTARDEWDRGIRHVTREPNPSYKSYVPDGQGGSVPNPASFPFLIEPLLQPGEPGYGEPNPDYDILSFPKFLHKKEVVTLDYPQEFEDFEQDVYGGNPPSFPGAGNIRLKSHRYDEPLEFQPFHMGNIPEPFGLYAGAFRVLICRDCIIEGEEFAPNGIVQYYQGEGYPLDGTPMMTEVNDTGPIFSAGWWLSWIFHPGMINGVFQNDESFFFIDQCRFGNYPEDVTIRDMVARNTTFVFASAYSPFAIEEGFFPRPLEKMTVENVKVIGAVEDPDGTLLPMLMENGDVIDGSSKATIRNCYISSAWPGAGFDSGITLTSDGMNFEITGNEVDMQSNFFGSYGITTFESIEGIASGNSVRADIGFLGSTFGNPVFEDNSIEARNAGFMGLLSSSPQTGFTVRNNRVHMDNTGSIDAFHETAGILGLQSFFFDLVWCFDPEAETLTELPSMSQAVFEGNSFSGEANYGVYMGQFFNFLCPLPNPEPPPEFSPYLDFSNNNRFIKNDFGDLECQIATVFLGEGTSDNVFGPNMYMPGGARNGVVDEGTNNRVVGLPAKDVDDPGIGNLVSQSMKSLKKKQMGLPHGHMGIESWALPKGLRKLIERLQ
jgi:hypothetical protein